MFGFGLGGVGLMIQGSSCISCSGSVYVHLSPQLLSPFLRGFGKVSCPKNQVLLWFPSSPCAVLVLKRIDRSPSGLSPIQSSELIQIHGESELIGDHRGSVPL